MRILSISASKSKGARKSPVDEAFVIEGHGLEGDAQPAHGIAR